jgi:MFS family permease
MKLSSAQGRWVVAGAVLGSGAVFLEGTVRERRAAVHRARPALWGSLGCKWVMNAYLLTLSSLMLLGRRLGRSSRAFTSLHGGALGFATASVACAFAPNAVVLVACRLAQGVAGALLVPNSLAMLEAAFEGKIAARR